jgi:hypothetical protein
MDYALHRYGKTLPVPFWELLALGRVNPQNPHEPFCMTVLALKLSRAANAVSELHGRMSRQMWQCLHPGKPVEQVPIGHITNGIHLLGWMKGTVRRFWQRKWLPATTRPRAARAPDWDADPTPVWQRWPTALLRRNGARAKLRRIDRVRPAVAHQGPAGPRDFIAFDSSKPTR